MSRTLTEEDTLITVYNGLTHPRAYAVGALHKMRACRREHGNASVRIGITGSGQKPCFRVTYMDAGGAEQIYGSWWDTGDALVREDAQNQNWAQAIVDFAALENFLAERLGYDGPRPKA